MGLFGNNTRDPERIEKDIEKLDELIENERQGKGDLGLDTGDLVVDKLEKMAEKDRAKKERESITDQVFDAFF